MRLVLLTLALTRCTTTRTSVSTSADADAGPPPEVPVTLEALDVPRPSPEVGALVPWMPASAWTGKGIPPKQFSLFTVPDGSPVLGYAALGRDACEAELTKRAIPFARAEDIAGVRAPIRLTGPVRGVSFHSMLPPAQRAKSRLELIDCRLAVSLDDFGKALAARGIVEVIHLSAYRSKNESGCTVKYPGEQHCAALALDIGTFVKRDGTKLVVERDWRGKIGALTCATHPPPNELWAIACEAAGKQFQVILTPNWNAEHRNHMHVELTVHDWVLAR